MKSCNEFFPSSRSKHNIQYNCKICARKHTDMYKSTLKGCFHDLLSNCKSLAKKRKIRKNQFNEVQFSLTFDHLLKIYFSQKGRCFYSNIPLKYEVGGNWRMSVARLNNDCGYTCDNVALVCTEFTGGMLKWSREKVEIVWGKKK